MKEKSECLFSHTELLFAQNHFPQLRLFFPVTCWGPAGCFLAFVNFYCHHISYFELGLFFLLLSLCLVHHGCVVFCLVFYYFLSFSWLVFILLWLWTFFHCYLPNRFLLVQIGFLCSVHLAGGMRCFWCKRPLSCTCTFSWCFCLLCSLSMTSCLVSKIGCFSQLALRLSVSKVRHVITWCRHPCKTSSTSCFGTLPHCLWLFSLEIRRCNSTLGGFLILHQLFFVVRAQLSRTLCDDQLCSSPKYACSCSHRGYFESPWDWFQSVTGILEIEVAWLPS